ncbi:MAG: MFS transporter, partial [Tetrasphaera sp.]|nr:MFS transporter [Tetrasphaera sp.]
MAALLLRLPPRVDGEPADPARLEFLPRDGIRELRRHPALVLLVWALLPLIVTLESVNAVEVFLLRDVLGASAFQFGLGEAAAGTGAVVGAFGAGAVHGTRRR